MGSVAGASKVTQAEVVLQIGIKKGESPVWSTVDELLYFVDIDAMTIHSYDPSNGALDSLKLSAMIGAVIPTKTPGLLVAAMEQEVVLVSFDSKSEHGRGIQSILSTVPLEHGSHEDGWRFNDCRASPGGQLIAGRINIHTLRGGRVYKIPSPVTGPSDWQNPEVIFEAGSLQLPNGMVWDSTKRKVWYCDTAESVIFVYDCDDLGVPDAGTRSTFLDLTGDEGEPDGMTIDAHGNLWVALHAGGRVICIHPETKELLHTIQVPVKSVSACNWGGPGLRTLYITTIANDVEEPEPLAGALFKAEIDGVHGARAALTFSC